MSFLKRFLHSQPETSKTGTPSEKCQVTNVVSTLKITSNTHNIHIKNGPYFLRVAYFYFILSKVKVSEIF